MYKKNENISICMATYNGEKFVAQQIFSILQQMRSQDELIIVDDCSTDNTLTILRNINDPRIKIFKNEKNRGHVATFSICMTSSSNEFIFLSDQDDIWPVNRLNVMLGNLQKSGCCLLASNQEFIDAAGNTIDCPNIFLKHADSTKYFKNIINIFLGNISYFGCLMAFKRNLVDVILPIPNYVESHDLWIAIAGNLLRLNIHIEDITLKRRIHGNNVTQFNRNLFQKVMSRFIFGISIIHLFIRVKKIGAIRVISDSNNKDKIQCKKKN